MTMIIGKAFAPTVLLCAGIALGAAAETAPRGQVDARIGALLGQEQAALGAVEPGHLERIVGPAAPEPPAARPATPPRDELACLARALYHEARGEGAEGMRAVAEVVLNRVDAEGFPRTICGVVYQGVDNAAGCQFSFVCDGSDARPIGERSAWSQAQSIAREMADGAPRRLTGGATHFHTTAVSPGWAEVYTRTAQVGTHLFYRSTMEVALN